MKTNISRLRTLQLTLFMYYAHNPSHLNYGTSKWGQSSSSKTLFKITTKMYAMFITKVIAIPHHTTIHKISFNVTPI